MRVGFADPDVYLNLGRLYWQSGQQERALTVLRKGLRSAARGAPSILRELERLNPRSRPVVPPLDRNNPVNKGLGKLRAWVQRKVSG